MIACVHVDHFGVAIARKTDPALSGVPVLVVKYGSKRSQVQAVSAEAAGYGVTAGMSLSRARGLCPTAYCVAYDQARFDSARDELLHILWDYTNRVELDEAAFPQTGIFYLDLGQLKPDDAYRLGEQIQRKVSGMLSASVSVGLASGKFPARVAAVSCPSAVTQVPRHAEADFVAPHPVDLLPLSKPNARKLSLLCIRTIGQLAQLPRLAVAGQFGRDGQLLYLLSQGLDGRPVTPRQMPRTESVSRSFDTAITNRHRLDTALHQLADELAYQLKSRHVAGHALTLTLELADGQTHSEQIHRLKPATQADAIARTLGQLLERMTLTGGVDRLQVDATHLVSSTPRQLALFTQKSAHTQLIHLAQQLSARHTAAFYTAYADNTSALIPEMRFGLNRIASGDAS